MSHNDNKDNSSKISNKPKTDEDDREEDEELQEEEMTHEYMESYLDKAQRDIQRLIERSSSSSISSSDKQQASIIKEAPSSNIDNNNINTKDSEISQSKWFEQKIPEIDSRRSSNSCQQKNPQAIQQSNPASQIDSSSSSSETNLPASSNLTKDSKEKSRYATPSPTFDDNGNIIRPSSKRTSFSKSMSGSKFQSSSREDIYQDTLKSSLLTDTSLQLPCKRYAIDQYYNRIQLPVGTSSVSNISTPLSRLNECEAITRRLLSSPIRPNLLIQQHQQTHTQNPVNNSQTIDTAAARRASLGTNTVTDQLSCSLNSRLKDSQHGLLAQDLGGLRLSGSDLYLPESTKSTNRANLKTGQPILSRTSVGQLNNLISGSNQSSSSGAIGKISSTSSKSSPLRSLSPASSGASFFNFKRSFLSFDSGNKNENASDSGNLTHKASSLGEQNKRLSSASSSIKARRSIASPLVFSSSIGGIFSGNKHIHQQSSLTSNLSAASLSVDSIPNTLAQQQDILSGQPSAAITALVTAAVGSRKSFYENVDYSSLEPNKQGMGELKECDIGGLKPEAVAQGRSMSMSSDDARRLSQSPYDYRTKLPQSSTESRLQVSNKGYLVPLFGCDINSIELLTKVGLILPPVIDSAMQHVLINGINSVGIFRKSGVKSRILILRKRIESNQGFKFDYIEQTEFSIYDVADLIKMWFRELKPSPLLTKELIRLISSNIALIKSQKQINSSFGDAAASNTSSSSSLLSSLPPSSTCKQAFNVKNHTYVDLSQRIIALISSSHRAILIRVLEFFSQISSKCDFNQMTAQNLAICLTPSLCATEADQQSILLAQKALEYCINNYESLFMLKPTNYNNQRSNSLIDNSQTARKTTATSTTTISTASLDTPSNLPRME